MQNLRKRINTTTIGSEQSEQSEQRRSEEVERTRKALEGGRKALIWVIILVSALLLVMFFTGIFDKIGKKNIEYLFLLW